MSDLTVEPSSTATTKPVLSEMENVSVIIPVKNEEENLRRLLPALTSLRPEPEIVVAEAGSADGSIEVARRFGAKVIVSSPGRGTQLNAGASLATGGVLLFLHADSRLTQFSWDGMLMALDDRSVDGGAFGFSLADEIGIWPRIYEFFVNLRSRFLNLPYGDQGYFVRRETWDRLGPYREIPLMEDVHLWSILRRRGNVKILRQPLVTSGRRIRRRGWIASAVRNWALLLAWKLGVPASRLVEWYK